MTAGTIKDYIGYGTLAARPVSPAITAVSGGSARYYATDVSTEYAWDGSAWQGVSGAAVSALSDTLLGSSQATFPLTSLGGYKHLRIYVYARTTSATNGTDLITAQANGDTGANYNWEQIVANTTATSAANGGSVTSMQMGYATGGGSAANLFDMTIIDIVNYGTTSGHKLFRSQATRNFGLGAGNLILVDFAGYWASTAALTSLTLTPASGSFATGSRATVYALA